MFRGLVIPAIFVASGLYILVTGEGYIGGGSITHVLRVFDGAVTALAISWFGLAAICHFRWFWRDRRLLWRMAEIGQVAGLLVWLISWLYVLGSVLRSRRSSLGRCGAWDPALGRTCDRSSIRHPCRSLPESHPFEPEGGPTWTTHPRSRRPRRRSLAR